MKPGFISSHKPVLWLAIRSFSIRMGILRVCLFQNPFVTLIDEEMLKGVSEEGKRVINRKKKRAKAKSQRSLEKVYGRRTILYPFKNTNKKPGTITSLFFTQVLGHFKAF